MELCQTSDLFELSVFYLFILVLLSHPSIAVEAIELRVLRCLFLFSRGVGHFDCFCGFLWDSAVQSVVV
jgi:hypothetical protein